MADIKKILTRVKDYVTQEDNLEEQARIDAINALDLTQVGSDGNYIKFVSQEDGQVTAQKQAFDTVIDTNSNDTNAPTSKAVKDHVQAELNKLDIASQGGNGKYIRSILEEDGKISATPQDFDTDFTNPSNNNAPTTQAVQNLINSLDANQVGQDGHYIKTISEENGIITATKEAFETSIPSSNPSEVLAPTVKAVKTYVDAEIGKLDATLGNATHLVSIIKEVDGKLIEVTGPEILGTINASADIPTSGAVKTYADAINTDLQTQIDNLKSVQNVAEVVADVTTLNQLDKSKYDENDKVQVIDDINHAHATTVYRLTNNTWDYVGSYGGDSYTKTQADERFVQKTFEINSHALSGNNISLDKTDIGLGNVDNTSDANKPVSTAQQTALNEKVDKTTTVNGHALSGNVTVTKADVLLGNVDNTSDANKPISTATQSALDLKADKSTTYTKAEINTKLANIPLTLSYENAELYEVFNDGHTQTVVTVDTLSTDLAAANTLSISGARGSITATQYNKLNKETIVIWEAPDNSGNVALHYSSLVNINEPCYQGFYGLPFTDGMITVLVTFSDDLTWEVIYDGAIAETTANRVSAFQNNPDNTHYPTEKLVKDYVDNSIETASEITDNDYNDIADAFQAALNQSVEE